MYNGVENRFLAKKATQVGEEISSRVNTWLENNNNFVHNYNLRYRDGNEKYRADSGDWLSAVSTQKSNFRSEADHIKAVLSDYEDFLDPNWAKRIRGALDSGIHAQEQIVSAATADRDYWAQWDSEEAYDMWYQGYKAEQEILGAEDFAHYSDLGAGIQNPKLEDVSDRGFSIGGKLIFGSKGAEIGNIVTMSRDNADYLAVTEANGGNASDYGLRSLYRHMKDNEVAIYNYYLGKGDRETADQYLASLEDSLVNRQQGREIELAMDTAKNHPILASVLSTGMSLASGAEFLRDTVNGDSGGRNHASDVLSATRGTVAEQVDWEIGNWDAFDFVYNTAMSGVDSLAAGSLGLGSAGGALLGLSAAGQGVNDALDRGLSKDKAFWNGLFSGVFEGLFETFSLGQLNAMKQGASHSIKDIAKNIGKSMLTNASEEAATEIANIAYDTIANGEFAHYTWEELKNGAWKNALGQVLESGASGALMGAGFGGIGVANQFHNAKEIYGGNEREIMTEALEINPKDPEVLRLHAKLDGGRHLSGFEISRMVGQNDRTLLARDKAAIQPTVSRRLSALGAKGDVEALSAAITKQVAGETLSRAERQAIKDSPEAGQVLDEMNPENMRAAAEDPDLWKAFYENGDSSWAETIGTNRINAAEYGRMIKAMEAEGDSSLPSSDESMEPKADGFGSSLSENPAMSADTPASGQEVAEPMGGAPNSETAAEADFEVPEVAEPHDATPAVQSEEAAEAPSITLDEAAQKYGEQAGAMKHIYLEGQDVEAFDTAYKAAFDMGAAGVSLSYTMKSELTSYLTEEQRKLAHAVGRDAATGASLKLDAQNKAAVTGKTGYRKGVVKSEGVTLDEMKTSFNDTQGTAYKLLSTYAEVTGIDIVLYRSEADADGNFVGAQGKFKWAEDAIYIDIHAGLTDIHGMDDLAKYTMMRTFAHEFTHFLEKWDPICYNEFREAVFAELTDRGEDVHDLIQQKQAQDSGGNMTYEQASREVIAEAMTDILLDANFVSELAHRNKTAFEKLLEKLKEFVSDLKSYFNKIGQNSSREAKALREQVGESVKYVEHIVSLFDRVAVQAVENYQATVATEETLKEHSEGKAINGDTDPSANLHDSEKHAGYDSTPADISSDSAANEHNNDAFTITLNDQFGTLEVRFDGKPSEAVRNVLKTHKFRWHSKKGIWYGHGEKADLARDLRKAYMAEATTPTEEDNTNVKEQETGALLPHRSDGEGDSRLLADAQARDVSGDGAERDTLDSSAERGNETGRPDLRSDAEGDERGSGERSGESRDLRRDGEVIPEDLKQETVEPLHEEVVEEIARMSTESPRGRNFVIGDSLDLPGGEKARYKVNVEAIRLVKQLETEGRFATEAEQVILSKYVGWGGLSNAFDPRKADWLKEHAELTEILTKEEYESARGSTLNAHYTDISVIRAMYDGLARLGFDGGRMLEPSAGIGHFVGAMPSAMSAKVKSWTMVELDSITGLIAKHLYPHADVRIQGFEKANIPNSYMDVVISNVPFGNYPIVDKAYPKRVTGAIHNYFFAKALDKVRPGGIVMFITSSYTMNAKDSTVRRYIMQRADLLGAIRLPDSAFKGNAATDVVTDILILKKRPAGTDYAGEDFLESPYTHVTDYNGAYINTYFEKHPEMVLGRAVMTGSMYRGDSLTYKAFEDRGSLADQIREAFSHIEGRMDYPTAISREKANFAVERANKKVKQNGLVVREGKLFQNREGELMEVTASKGVIERVSGMLEIRDAARELMAFQQQGLKDSEIRKARTKLNKAYDAFVAKHGFINAPANRAAISDDPDKFSIFALENWDSESKKATKADIFTKNTVSPNRTVTSAKDVADGLIVSINQTGGVDTALIARLTGKTESDVSRELIDGRMAFKNRDGNLETAEVYLAGNVRAKLRDAEALVPIDPDYRNNVEALRAVIPEDVGYQDIFVSPGTPWIPNTVYSDFAAYMLGGRNTEWRKDIDVTRNAETGSFTIDLKSRHLKTGSSNTQKWGTPRRSFLDLFDAMLNSKSVVVKDKLEDGSSVINKDATAAANEKVENIQKEFQEWLWRDEGRRAELVTLYNEVFNAIVTPKYNGDNLTVNGANAMKPLRPHQRNAVQRVISSGGNTLLAHKVGAGKTYEMAAAAMKLKELGLVKKPMFAVPKSLVAQWGVEFKDFFPAAKLLVADASDFTTANRKVFMNRVANGEYDAVIVSYEQFEKLPMSDDFTRSLYQEQVDSIVAAIEEAKAEKGDKALSIKDLEKKRKSLQAKIDKLTDKAKDEDNIDFEQLGVDSLFVDEAHNFKNLFYTTSMTNVAGLGNKEGSKRAFDLYTKVRYLQKLNGGRGIVFATATPVMNSMSEMYIMQKYLQPDLLDQLGLSTFDAWAKQFGEVVNGVEIKPSGQGYRVKQSFSRFKNMGELQLLFRNFADVLTDIPGLKIPTMKGGKVNVVVCEPGQFQKDFMKELEKRADGIKNVDPSVDNMLKITSDGRKISYTQRMIDPSLPYEEGCKIFRCADNVAEIYAESKAVKGTQLIFCDMATPKGKSKNDSAEGENLDMDMESAQLYDDIKARLIAGGIPAKEIAFIHDADTDAKKKKLFSDVNEGKVRVLIGSTGKMGVGMNAQKRVVAIHHLDAPWRPGDVEQRNGRAFRQGNINDQVECFTYVTEGSFDARLWDILERKQNFINQIMNGESVGREAEDTGEVTLSAAEVKALASGSPLIMEQVQLDTDIKKLESLYRSHISAIRAAKDRLSRDRGTISVLEDHIQDGKADIAQRKDTFSEGKFSMTIGKRVYTDKKDAGVALMAEARAQAVETDYTTVASFAGFDLRVVKTHEGIGGIIQGHQGYPFNTYPNNTSFMVNHLIAQVEGIDAKVSAWESSLSETRADLDEQEKLIREPFAKQTELEKKRARYNEVMDILNPKEEQSLDVTDEDPIQEQSRTYLANQKYGYEWFMKKPDMALTVVDDSIKYTRADLVSHALKNAASVGHTNQNGNAVVHVKDIDTDVIVPKRSLVHGLDRRMGTQAPVIAQIGDILKNSIRINELIPRTDEIKNAYALIGAARNQDGNLYIASFVVNKYSNEITEIDVLYSANAKKESAAFLPKITDKSATPTDSKISIAHLLEFVNRYFPDILPEEVLRHYGHESRPDGVLGKNTLYQQRTNTLTDRDVLAMAADRLEISPDLNAGERDALRIFRERLNTLQVLQSERQDLGRLYKEQQFGAKVDRKAAAATLNRMHVLDDRIKDASSAVLSVEDKQVLKRVLEKARKVVEEQERQHGKEILARWRDRTKHAADIKKYRERISKDAQELYSWITKPDNKSAVKHVPDALKDVVIPFLTSIDFTSKRQLRGGEATQADKEFAGRLEDLRRVLSKDINVDELYSGYVDLPADFMENLDAIVKNVETIVGQSDGSFVINRMTSEELKDLSSVVRLLKTSIMNANRFLSNAMFEHVQEAGDNTISSLQVMKSNNGKSNATSNFLFWQQMRPAYAFERFGEGGKAIYDGLRRGQAQLAFNTHRIVEFSKQAYTTDEVRVWEKELKSIPLGSDMVKMKISHIMSFYELSKQKDSLRHILNGGIRVATYTKDGKKISDNGHTVTEDDVQVIIDTLTPRQKEVADTLQKFMAKQGGAWGNYVSVARFGEEQFGNPDYFPINSDGRKLRSMEAEEPNRANLYALLNMSFTKTRDEKANNRIMLYSIFDVFSNHMASMAQYNAMALPVLDALKWFSYRQTEVGEDGHIYTIGSVREQMARVYGAPEETRIGRGSTGYAESFVLNILKAFNGTEAQGVPTDTMGIQTLRRYNMAQVAFNFRVVVQQPLAIARAALLIDYSSIIKGLKLSSKSMKRNAEEMQKYSGIAAWKALGFYDVNISRGLSEIIKHDSKTSDKVRDVGMWGAEKADQHTWAAIWSACKEEVSKKKHLHPGDEGFYEAVTTLFEDVIYKTQVVDSILTKNEYMRSKGFFARATASFMSEPTTTASMVLNAYDKYHMDMQKGMDSRQAWRKNRKMIGRTIYVYAVSQTLLSAVTAVVDAWRDDDEHEDPMEKWAEAFGGNLIDELAPFNKLPIMSDFYELIKELASLFGADTYGNPPQSVFMQWYDSLVKGVDIVHDKLSGEDTAYTWYGGIYKLLQAVSGMVGVPMAAATREVIAIWNNVVGSMAPSLKVRSYAPGDEADIRYAYLDGHLTADEATSLLLEKGLADNQDEAYFTIQGWDAGEGYSRYDAVYDAVRNGGDLDTPMAELLDHGYNKDSVMSHIKGQIGRWYTEGGISKTQAISMLDKYFDMDDEEITKTVNRWSAKVVTGIAYDEIDDEFMAGNISAARASDMYRLYGSMSQEDADKKVTVLAFVKEHPECEGLSSYSAVEGYTTYCEPAGVEASVFYEVYRFHSDAHADLDKNGKPISGSKKAKVLEYIDTLDLTRKQKDSLYFALGWSKSTLKDAPWR